VSLNRAASVTSLIFNGLQRYSRNPLAKRLESGVNPSMARQYKAVEVGNRYGVIDDTIRSWFYRGKINATRLRYGRKKWTLRFSPKNIADFERKNPNVRVKNPELAKPD
jgi:hypothetical protein